MLWLWSKKELIDKQCRGPHAADRAGRTASHRGCQQDRRRRLVTGSPCSIRGLRGPGAKADDRIALKVVRDDLSLQDEIAATIIA